MALLSQDQVDVAADGTLTLSGSNGLDDRPVKYRWLGDGAWQSPDDATRRLWFKRDAAGQWQMNPRLPVFMSQRMPWTRDARLWASVLALSLAVMAASLLAWAVAAVARWRFRAAPPPRAEQRARMALRGACALAVLPWLLFAAIAARASASYVWLSGPDVLAWLRAVQAGSWLALAGIALAAGALHARSRAKGSGWWGRVHAAAVMLAAMGLAAIAWQGHLLLGVTAL